MNRLRFVFACGGTSGHVYPAIAIAEKIRRDCPDADIRFFGTSRGLESEVVPKAGFPFTAIRARGFPRKLSPDLFRAAADFLAGRRQCRRLLRDISPNAVIGTGGYVAGPVVAAAASLGIPVILHEQNAFPGRSNRLMARRSKAVCVSFPGTEKHFPAGTKIVLTGNPVREVFFTTDRQTARQALGFGPDQPVILATGGSQGARKINQAVLGLDNFDGIFRDDRADGGSSPILILAAGKQHADSVREAAAGKNWLDVFDYIENIHLTMAAADLVICRAGAGSCFELAALGKPSILVPYPFATGDHQTFNARTLADAGAALLCPDADLTSAALRTALKQLFADPGALARMGRAAAALARPDAADSILKTIRESLR